MDIDQQRIKAMNICIDIANDFTEEEVKKFMPKSVQIAWEIGNDFLEHDIKETRKRLKGFKI